MKIEMKKLKVFHGLVNYGTQAGFFAKELRNKGIDALSFVYVDPYKRPSDVEFKYGGNFFQKVIRHSFNWFFRFKCILKYNIFHFYAGTTLLPNQIDLFLYKILNKKVIFHYLGTEVQGYQTSIEKYKWTNVIAFKEKEDPIMGDRLKFKRLKYETRFADLQIVCAPCYSEFVPNSIVIPLGIELKNYSFVKHPENVIPVIMHAPTDLLFKGTSYIEEAIKKLENEGYVFIYNRVTGLSHDKIRDKYVECDLFIDQIMGGWYGTAAIEAMAIGRPVICSIRESYFEHIDFAKEIPIVHADPDCIYDAIKMMLDNKENLAQLGLKSRTFVEQQHDIIKLTEKLIDIYEKL